jgi:hypothetical protein
MYFVAKSDTEIAGVSVEKDDVIMADDSSEDKVVLTIGDQDVEMSPDDFESQVVKNENLETVNPDDIEVEEETMVEAMAEYLGIEDGDESMFSEEGDLNVDSSVDTKALFQKILETGDVRGTLSEAIDEVTMEAGPSAMLKALQKKLGGSIKAVKKVVGGKVINVFKRIGGKKKKLSSKQKSGLMKARKKSHSGAALAKLRKSLKVASKMHPHK